MPVIGFVRSASFDGTAELVAAFRQGLRDAGYVEGQNVVIIFRSAEGRNDRRTQVPKLRPSAGSGLDQANRQRRNRRRPRIRMCAVRRWDRLVR